MADVKIIVNCETGSVEEVPLTPEEILERDQLAAQAETERLEREAQAQADADAKASAMQKLADLGLSEAEITALVG